MNGKYSADWWERIAVIERENPARQDAASIVDRLIQATASGGQAPAKGVKRRSLGSTASKEKSSLAS